MKINKFGVPEELAALNKEKYKIEEKRDTVTYQTVRNINETLKKTSEEFGSQGVYGSSVGTFFIPENIFNEGVDTAIVEEVQ